MKYVYFLFVFIDFLLFCMISPSLAVDDKGDPSYQSLKNYMDRFYKYKTEKKEEAKPPQPPRSIPVTLLPRDKYGLIDWAGSIRNGIISPLSSIDGLKEDDDPINLIVPIKAKNEFMTDVMFPHSIHTYWLSCKNCHPGIFVQKKGGNSEMTMWKILDGQYCGRCHGKIAFPLRECYRCHMDRQPKIEDVKNQE